MTLQDQKKTYISSSFALGTIALAALLVLITAFFAKDERNSRSAAWPLEGPVEYQSFYVQQADAWLKGQITLDVRPDPRLAEMENPYDTAARKEAEIPYLFDRAYYNGKYYSYFGLTPLILVMFPHFFLTGTFPSFLRVSLIFSLAALPCLFYALLGLFRYFKLSFRRLDFICLYLGLTAGSLLPYALRCADNYFLPFQAAYFAVSWVLAASFAALREDISVKRSAGAFALAGMGLIALLQSRPSQLLFLAFFLAPFYLKHLLRKDLSLRAKVLQVGAFVLAVLPGLLLTFYYNQLRFSGILDFGEKYQLTLADVNSYRLRPEWFWPSFESNFLRPPVPAEHFPFFDIKPYLRPLKHFLYRGPVMGMLIIPLNWLLLLAPLAWGLERLKRPGRRPGMPKVFVLSLFLGLGSIVFLSWYIFCLAGSLMRYICDLSLPLAFMSCFVSLPLFRRKEKAALWLIDALCLLCLIFVIIMPRV